MKSQSILRSVALFAALALAIPCIRKPVTKTITIANPAKVGKYDLKAGEYRLMIDGNKATIQQGKRMVAETEGRWEDRDTKAYCGLHRDQRRRTSARSALLRAEASLRHQRVITRT